MKSGKTDRQATAGVGVNPRKQSAQRRRREGVSDGSRRGETPTAARCVARQRGPASPGDATSDVIDRHERKQSIIVMVFHIKIKHNKRNEQWKYATRPEKLWVGCVQLRDTLHAFLAEETPMPGKQTVRSQRRNQMNSPRASKFDGRRALKYLGCIGTGNAVAREKLCADTAIWADGGPSRSGEIRLNTSHFISVELRDDADVMAAYRDWLIFDSLILGDSWPTGHLIPGRRG